MNSEEKSLVSHIHKGQLFFLGKEKRWKKPCKNKLCLTKEFLTDFFTMKKMNGTPCQTKTLVYLSLLNIDIIIKIKTLFLSFSK